MYEQYFGLQAPPFQINPDPGFYFESKGHASAYQYLRFGAFQGEGFIVVTGEIGAGKTTLLRALLEELDPARVVAAQLVSTQLGGDDLLSAVALAFGIRTEGLSKAKLLVTLEAFLATLATSGRRALLIIDEAQNLGLESIEELRMLSNFQFGNRALLQSFLVGQPELRELLRQPRLEQLRQRVLASCHLGPMDADETRRYIEHRLRHVGWQQRPGFEPRAFELIHQATGGVPRRINILCNRLLLSAYLDEAQRIDMERVRRVDRELRAEVSTGLPGAAEAGARADAAPLLGVAGSNQALWALGVLQRAFAQREDLPPMQLLRVVGSCAIQDDAQAVEDLRALGVDEPGIAVPLGDTDASQCVGDVVQALAAQIQLHQPCALLCTGDGLVDLACALAAMASRIALVSVETGAGRNPVDVALRRRRGMLAHAADLLFVPDDAAGQALISEGIASDAVHRVGSVAVDAVRLGLAHGVSPALIFGREGVSPSLFSDPAGYVLVVPRDAQHGDSLNTLVELELSLRGLGWRVALVCPVRQQRQLLADALARAMATDVHVVRVGAQAEWLSLLRHARCVLTDDAWMQAQALALGVPFLELPMARQRAEPTLRGAKPGSRKDLMHVARQLVDIIAGGGRRVALAETPDGHCADRIASQLADWLLARQDHDYHRYLQRA